MMISWKIIQADFEYKRGASEDEKLELGSIYADKTERNKVDDGVWTHRALFDNEIFKIEVTWRIKEEEDVENIHDEISDIMVGEHFTISHMLDFMQLGTSPLMPLEEEEHARLQDTSEED